jgi:hypothetical protein
MRRLFPVILLIIPCAIFCQDYYVSTSGSDSLNDGKSVASPFQTIQKAASSMISPGTCYIRGGVYRESVKPAASGSAGAYITFMPYMNESVTVTGADLFSGSWSSYSSTIYQVSTVLNFSQVFVDSLMMNKARWPNTACGDLLHPVNATATAGTNYLGLQDPNLPAGSWNGAYVWIQPGDGWGSYVEQITSYLPGSGFTFSTPIATSGDTNYEPRSGNPYYIFGSLSGLDSAGEWFLDITGSKFYLWTPDSAAPSAHKVEYKARNYAFMLDGLSYIYIYNINIFASAISLGDSYHCVVDDCRMKYVDHYEAMAGYNVPGGEANYISGAYNEYKNCEIAYSAGCGIYIQGYDNYVTNCLIHDTGYMGSNHGAIMTEGGAGAPTFGHVLSHNTIYNTGRFGIYHPASTQIKILYNDISQPGLLSKDCGPIYSYGLDANYTEIAYNWLHDNYTKYGAGVYLDNGTNNHLVHHNVAWNLAGTGIVLNTPSENNRIYNNTVLNCLNSFSYYGNPAQGLGDIQDQSGTVVENNIADMSTASFCTKYPPTVVNNGNYPVAGNFVPATGSGAIDSGLLIPGITDGYIGSAPDVGAYEYAGAYWVPGYNAPAPTPTAGGPAFTPTCTYTPAATPTITPTYPVYSGTLIDDFSDCNMTNALGGSWMSYNDSGNGGISTVSIAVSPPGYGGTGCALQVSGTVINNPGGPSPFIDFGADLASDRDYSSCLGVRFEFNGDNRYYNIRLVADTAVNTGYNDYKYSFFAASGWQFYMVPFSSFTQAPAWGIQVGRGTVLSQVKQVLFNNAVIPPAGDGYNVNVSVDNVEIYGCGLATPTATPTQAGVIPGQILDDCNDNNNTNLWGGPWYTVNDTANNGVSTAWPPATAFVMSAPGYGGTGYAARLTGTVKHAAGYAYPDVAIGTDFGGIYSFDTCSGVRFRYKNDGKAYYVKIACDASIPTGYNYYRFSLPASSSWTQISIPFSSMTQASGWGITVDPSVFFSKTTGIQFQTDSFPAAGSQWDVDLWIDDIEIYGCPGVPTPAPTLTFTMTPAITATRTSTPTPDATPTMTPTTTALAITNLDRLYVQPSMYKSGPGIYFRNLTPKAVIKIYNIKGELVHSASAASAEYLWRFTGVRKADQVSSGIYIYTVTDGRGGIKQGKLAVVKK